MRNVGLARALSKFGVCSRSQAAEHVRAGRVRLNGIVRRDPEWPVRMDKDRVELDGAHIRAAKHVYLMLNKPRGLITTVRDEQGRDTVFGMLAPDLPFVAPVGRLDKASEGLLLFTNDSEWAQQLLDPETHLAKTYHVQISGSVDEALLQQLREGLVDRGEELRAKAVEFLRRGAKNAWLEIVLDEGKNRQIRRMLRACDREVLRLVRIAIGPLTLGDLSKGKSRLLTAPEKAALDRALRRSRGVR